MEKQNVGYTYSEMFFSLKKGGNSDTTTWKNLEDIMLSDISQ